jgi:integrase
MPRRVLPLTESIIKRAAPAASVRKITDGQVRGLKLWVFPDGAKRWRLAYTYAGKQREFALGTWPQISLSEARRLADEASRLLRDGKDPVAARRTARAQAAKGEATFSAMADALRRKKEAEGKSARTIEKHKFFLAQVKPLHARPAMEITAAEVLDALKPIEAAGKYETATRTRAFVGEVLRYSAAQGLPVTDVSPLLRGALTRPITKHRAAITEPNAFGALLRAIDGYEQPLTRAALQLLALTAVRPGELRRAEWSEFDQTACTWVIPAAKMKMRRPHRVPLSAQALALLDALRPITGWGRYLFPAMRGKDAYMGENTMNAALRRLGYHADEVSPHGFRASFSSFAHGSRRWSHDAVERHLAHAERDKVKAAYDRDDRWQERVAISQWWADYCDEMKRGARGQVVTLRA